MAIGHAALIALLWGMPSWASPPPPAPTLHGGESALRQWWSSYCRNFIGSEGRVIRVRDGRDTVSEGQAYALLFAVFLDDLETFEKLREWTRQHLSREREKGDRLLGWRWAGGKVQDWNSAADADVDYALALLLAHRRWKLPGLLEEARAVAEDILRLEVADLPGIGLALLPGTWAGPKSDGAILNPSYFNPAAFRLFAESFQEARWRDLAETSYALWEKSGRRLGRMRGAGLPPDWCAVSAGGTLSPAEGRSSAFGWDALRTPMRAGMDALLFADSRSRRYLSNVPLKFYRSWLSRPNEHMAAVYAYSGAAQDRSESLAMTAMALFAFQAARESPPDKLVRSFERQRSSEEFAADYYAQSLCFFPLAHAAGLFEQAWLKELPARPR